MTYLLFVKCKVLTLLVEATMTQYSINSLEDCDMYFGKQTFYKVRQQSNKDKKAKVKFA